MIIPNFDAMTIEELEDFLDTWMDFQIDPRGWIGSNKKTQKLTTALGVENLHDVDDLLSCVFFTHCAKNQRQNGNIKKAGCFEATIAMMKWELPENLRW